MTAFAGFLLAALAVLPSDRLAMADRLFNRGEYAEAKTEYAALRGEPSVAADELAYRLAECERALGNAAAAGRLYGELLAKFPESRHADRARLARALSSDDDVARRLDLKTLDSDRVDPSVRAVALYHLGVATSDSKLLERAVRTDPKGKLAPYARYRRAAILVESKDAAVRRSAVGELLEIAFGENRELAPEALYLAGVMSYGDKRYGEAASLFRRYLKCYPEGKMAASVRTMCAWSLYLSGRAAEAASLCGEATDDDSAYLRAAAAQSLGDAAKSRTLLEAYLESHPTGRYRENVELALSRLEFAEAEKKGDFAQTLESARRSAALSRGAADRMRLAWALERSGAEREALAEYAAIAEAFPGTDEAVEALYRKALVDLRASRWAAAEMALAVALKSGANAKRRAEMSYWRGVASVRLGHAQEGAALLTEAVKAGLSLDQEREARLLLADQDYAEGRMAEARQAYARLVREGATERMSAAKLLSVGRFLLDGEAGVGAPAEAELCAKALVAVGTTPEWRQAAHALAGACAERQGELVAALAAYRRAMAEPAVTETLGECALALGRLEVRAGEYASAIATLERAVKLNARNAAARLEAYLNLARASEAKGDFSAARAYATVVVTLFDDRTAAAEAERILKAHPEAAE